MTAIILTSIYAISPPFHVININMIYPKSLHPLISMITRGIARKLELANQLFSAGLFLISCFLFHAAFPWTSCTCSLSILVNYFIPLWHGTLKCDSTDNVTSWDWAKLTRDAWQTHSKLVANVTQFFPSSFHCPPCNPTEKISSGYKATEYFHYLFGLGPGFFHVILPSKYWKNFCKLVYGVRVLTQRRITGAQLRDAHLHLIQFVEEFKNLYYQQQVDHLHFCQPCIHTLLHACPEVA